MIRLSLFSYCRSRNLTATVLLSDLLNPFTVLGCMLVCLLLPATGFAQAAAPGYAVSTFATGFPHTGPGGVGPVGLAFDASGNLLAMDYANGILYRFGPPGGAASAATQVNTTPIPGAPAGLAFSKDGSLFCARQGLSDVVQLDPSTGTILRTVATVPGATGIATDPVSGDLFVSAPFAGFVARISNFATGPGTVAVYAMTGFVDGLSFGPDGTLYAALSGHVAKIAGTNSAMPGAVTILSASVPSIDGIAVSSNANTPFIYGNRNNGTITKVDLTTTPPTLTNAVTGGSRGDFLTVGQDGCLYATQTDRVLKVTNADGTCLGGPLGPLFPSNPIAFSAFCAELQISDEDMHEEHGEFELRARFQLGSKSVGIDPVSEAFTLKIGTFSISLPAGSFTKRKDGSFEFKGEISGADLEVRIAPQGKDSFRLRAEGKGVDLEGLQKPISVTLTIGNDTGSTTAFTEEEEGEGEKTKHKEVEGRREKPKHKEME